MSSASPEVRTHSALHLLKGAMRKVVGPCKIVSAQASADQGRLVVRLEGSPNTADLLRLSLERSVNLAVTAKVEVVQFEMERQEAERHFGMEIYDSISPLAVGLGRLPLVRIPGWETDCCAAQEHVESTGEVGMIRIDRFEYGETTHLLEVEFRVRP